MRRSLKLRKRLQKHGFETDYCIFELISDVKFCIKHSILNQIIVLITFKK